MENNMKNITKLDYFLCFICSLFTSLNSDLNPFVNYIRIDSGVFLYIGKMMHRGYVPYLDVFDHKGIILYWIQYFGMFLSPGKYIGLGVWLIEIIHYFVFILFIYLLVRLFIKQKLFIYTIILTIALLSGNHVYVGGNLTETYSLPWITMSLYFIVKYLMQKKASLIETTLYGIGFTATFFLQANFVGLWLVGSLVLIIYFIKHKNIKDFKIWFFGFILGVLIVASVILGYLLYTHSLKDMINCYFIFNVKYTGGKSGSLQIVDILKTMIKLCGKTLITVPVILFTIFNNYKNKIYIVNFIIFITNLFLISINGLGSSKYGIIILPYLIVFCVFFYLNLEQLRLNININKTKVINILSILFIIGSILICILGFSHKMDIQSREEPYSIDYLRSVDKDSDVLVLTNDCAVNLLSGTSTQNKYAYQFPPVEFYNVLYDDFLKTFNNNLSDYVILEERDKEMFGNFDSMKNIYGYLCELSEAQIYKHIVFDHFEVFVLNKELKID